MENEQRAERLERLGDIVMEVYQNHPAYVDVGGIIGFGDNDIQLHEILATVLEEGGRKMRLTQRELANMAGSHASNWNEWYHRQRRPLPSEGNRTLWFINQIIILRLEGLVLAGPPPPPWPLRD
ncbi:unnamed protein product [Rotaria socialis]|uniref:Uncharacterized protein n=1 Tax=Rotaria socialis TaxID=392032 RepID=A0A821G8H4_9BILA|nr:unnamed protein product [Rotaria socialis]CAF3473065.1 unnamed protein product [Rotaria socialis]CAF3477662.1 unnamed protein product [Rotaria socialis]CAF3717710.1 unnamed protein product [Rotaria socialis]CAF3717724.1 unnamed protein product [Rotaria socialis]